MPQVRMKTRGGGEIYITEPKGNEKDMLREYIKKKKVTTTSNDESKTTTKHVQYPDTSAEEQLSSFLEYKEDGTPIPLVQPDLEHIEDQHEILQEEGIKTRRSLPRTQPKKSTMRQQEKNTQQSQEELVAKHHHIQERALRQMKDLTEPEPRIMLDDGLREQYIAAAGFRVEVSVTELDHTDMELTEVFRRIETGAFPKTTTGNKAITQAVQRAIAHTNFSRDFCPKCVRARIKESCFEVFYVHWNEDHRHESIYDRGTPNHQLQTNIKQDQRKMDEVALQVNRIKASSMIEKLLQPSTTLVTRQNVRVCVIRKGKIHERYKFNRPPTVDTNYFQLIASAGGIDTPILFDTGSDLTLANTEFLHKLQMQGAQIIQHDGLSNVDFTVADGGHVHTECYEFTIPLMPFKGREDIVFNITVLGINRSVAKFDGILLGRNNANHYYLQQQYDPTTGIPFLSTAQTPELKCPFLTTKEIGEWRNGDKVLMINNGEYAMKTISPEIPQEFICRPELYMVAAAPAWGENGRESLVPYVITDEHGTQYEFEGDPNKGERLFFEGAPRRGWDSWDGALGIQSGIIDPNTNKVPVTFATTTDTAVTEGMVLGKVSGVQRVLTYESIIEDIYKQKKKSERNKRIEDFQSSLKKLRQNGIDPTMVDFALEENGNIQYFQLTHERLAKGVHYAPYRGTFKKSKQIPLKLNSAVIDKEGIHVALPQDLEVSEEINEEMLEAYHNSLPTQLKADQESDHPPGLAARHRDIEEQRKNRSRIEHTGTWYTQQNPLNGISCKPEEIGYADLCDEDEETLKQVTATINKVKDEVPLELQDYTDNIIHQVGRVRIIQNTRTHAMHIEPIRELHSLDETTLTFAQHSIEEQRAIQKQVNMLDRVEHLQIPTARQGNIHPKVWFTKAIPDMEHRVAVIKSGETGEIFLDVNMIDDPEETYESLEGLELGQPPHLANDDEELDQFIYKMVVEDAEVETEEQRQELLKVMTRQRQIFYKKGTKIEPLIKTRHRIEVTSNRPIRYPPRTLSDEQQKIAKETIQEMIDLGVIRPSTSSYAAATVLVRKPDQSWRCCIDFRGLNAVTKKANNPLPLVNDIIRQIGTKRYFSSIDMYKGYWQLPMAEEDIDKTAFTTPFGLYEWLYMPMGLKNSGATYQKMMNETLNQFLGVCCCCYLDDVFIFSDTAEQHIKDIEAVMECLRKAGLRTRPDKTSLFRKSVKVLGYVLDEEGLKPIGEKINSIKEKIVPKTRKGIQSFLGLIRYYSRFVPHLSDMAAPLFTMLKKGVKVEKEWTDKQDKAIEDIKYAFSNVNDLLLTKFDPNRPILLQTDASNIAMGAVISHYTVDEAGNRIKEIPICYASKTFNKAQCNYSVTEKECLAVVWSTELFRSMLLQQSFILETDHSALHQILSTKDPAGRLCRWMLKLSEMDMQVVHRAGRLHQNVDYFSRDGCVEDEESDTQQTLTALKIEGPNNEMANVNKIQAAFNDACDEDIESQFTIKTTPNKRSQVEVKACFEGTSPASWDTMADYDSNSQVRLIRPNYTEEIGKRVRPESFAMHSTTDGTLIALKQYIDLCGNAGNEAADNALEGLVLHTVNIARQNKTIANTHINWIKKVAPTARQRADGAWEMAVTEQTSPSVYKTVQKRLVPLALTNEIISLMHRDGFAGHQSKERTAKMVKESYSWPGLTSQVHKYVQSCETCQNFNIPNKTNEIGEYPDSEQPFRVVAFDFCGPFGKKKKSHKYILVIVDVCSRFVFLVPTYSTEADEVMRAFRDHVITLCGVPSIAMCDMESSFVSKKFKSYCQDIGMLLKPVPAQASNSNGLIERTIRTVQNHVRRLIDQEQWDKKWTDCLSLVQFIMRNARRDDVNLSPSEIAFGFRVRGPWSSDLPEQTNALTPLQMWSLARREQREMRTHMDKTTRARIKEQTISMKSSAKFKAGDLIRRRIKNSRSKNLLPQKWWPQFKEVWRVVDQPGEHRYVCARVYPAPMRIAVLDGRNMKPAFPTGKEIDT